MTVKEKFHEIMGFGTPDRMLYWEQGFWGGAVERWYKEGMPLKDGVQGDPAFGDTVRGPATPYEKGDRFCADVLSGSGLDKPALKVPVNLYLCPKFEEKVLKEEEGMVTIRDTDGIVKKVPHGRDSIPHFISWPVENEKDFEKLAEERLNPDSPERYPSDWDEVVARLNAYDGVVGLGGFPCGFFGAPRFFMGEVALLIGFLDNPDLVHRIINHLADMWAVIYDKVLSQVKADCIHIWEDMSFKNGPLISPALFREFLVPAYSKVTDVAKSHGVKTILVDTDGDCTKLIPHFIDGGVTGMYPFEVQAGMDVKKVREDFPELQILGGVNKRELAKGPKAIDAELELRLPGMIEKGGYIPMADHQIPPDVSWQNYLYYRKRVAEISGGF